MKPADEISDLDKINPQDWALAAIAFIFLSLVPLVIFGGNVNLGMTTLAFAGPMFVFFVYIIRRKLRHQKQAPKEIRVTGGVPIHVSRTRIAKIGLLVSITGSIWVAFPVEENRYVFWGALAWAMLGLAMLIGVFTFIPNKNYLQFDPHALTLGLRSKTVVIPWSAIATIERGEMYNNQFVIINVNHKKVAVEPIADIAKIYMISASISPSVISGDFTIPSADFGFDAPDLVATLQRYVESPEARAELGTKP